MADLISLSRYRFHGKSEQAVREEWIGPLLTHLGYGITTLNEVRYEQRLALAAPFRRIGRLRVEVDYVPTVLGHGLWIIEAKAHESDQWDEALSQAWLYATHPEIDVPFMMIADGSRVAVYDVYKPDWDDPAVDIAAPELVVRFQELANVVGAAQITRAVRERRLRHIGAAMRAELSQARLDEYVQDVRGLATDARPSVRMNERSLVRDQLDVERRGREDAVREHGLFAIGVWTNQPLELNLEPARLAVEYVRALPPGAQLPELTRLLDAASYPTGVDDKQAKRCFWMLRITALEIYLALRSDNVCGPATTVLARQAIRDHVLDFPDDPVSRAAHRLERVLPVFVLRYILAPSSPNLTGIARQVQENWGDEARIRLRLDADRLLLHFVNELSRRTWTTIEWTAPTLDDLSDRLAEVVPSLQYRQDDARGLAGDQFLETYYRVDYLMMSTLDRVLAWFDPDLLDGEVRTRLRAIAEAPDLDERFLRAPARSIINRLAESGPGST